MCMPSPNPAGSFFKFFVGFLVLIGVSFAVTYGVQKYELANKQDQQVAAAIRVLLDD